MKKGLLILLCLPMIGFGQNVNIPDANFKAYLVGNTAINTNGDTEIQVSEATVFSGDIACPGLSISDLTGIESFISLNELRCQDNNLTSLDVSNNTALQGLQCQNNQITSLNVSGLSILQELVCFNNQLTCLDVSTNTEMRELYCTYNLLEQLSLNNGYDWENVEAENNNLTCIEVDTATAPPSGSYDMFVYFSTNCNYTNPCNTSTTIQEHSTNKQLLKITDLLGRETKQTNQPLFYIYDDGTVEKKIIIE